MSKVKNDQLKSLYHLGFQKPKQFFPKNRDQINDWDNVDIVVIHEKDKADKSLCRKDILYPNLPDRPEFCHEEYMAYRWFCKQKVENDITKRYDPIWKGDQQDISHLDFSIEGAGCLEIEKIKNQKANRKTEPVFKVPQNPVGGKKGVQQKRKPKTNEHLMPTSVIEQHNNKENIPFSKPRSPVPGRKSTNDKSHSRTTLSSLENTFKSKGSTHHSRLSEILSLHEVSESLSIHRGHHKGVRRNIILSDTSVSVNEDATSINKENEPHSESEKNESINNPPKIDPFSDSLIKTFLEKVEILHKLKTLESCTFTQNLKPLSKGQSLDIGKDSFSVVKSITKGGYGTIFSAKSKKTGKIYAFKQERPPNLWEYYLCLELHERIKDKNILPAFISIPYGLISDKASILVSDFSFYGSLLDVGNIVRVATGRCIDEIIICLIAKQIISIFTHLHEAEIIHADVKPDNFLLMQEIGSPSSNQSFVRLIDFGFSIDMKLVKTMYPKFDGFDVRLQKNTCNEMRDGRSWSYQLDWYGVAGTIHALLFGEYMKVDKDPKDGKWKPKMKIKRYLNQTLWEDFFETLLNIDGTHPNLTHIMKAFDQELKRKETFALKKIEEFNKIVSSRKK